MRNTGCAACFGAGDLRGPLATTATRRLQVDSTCRLEIYWLAFGNACRFDQDFAFGLGLDVDVAAGFEPSLGLWCGGQKEEGARRTCGQELSQCETTKRNVGNAKRWHVGLVEARRGEHSTSGGRLGLRNGSTGPVAGIGRLLTSRENIDTGMLGVVFPVRGGCGATAQSSGCRSNGE